MPLSFRGIKSLSDKYEMTMFRTTSLLLSPMSSVSWSTTLRTPVGRVTCTRSLRLFIQLSLPGPSVNRSSLPWPCALSIEQSDHSIYPMTLFLRLLPESVLQAHCEACSSCNARHTLRVSFGSIPCFSDLSLASVCPSGCHQTEVRISVLPCHSEM